VSIRSRLAARRQRRSDELSAWLAGQYRAGIQRARDAYLHRSRRPLKLAQPLYTLHGEQVLRPPLERAYVRELDAMVSDGRIGPPRGPAPVQPPKGGNS
jgi:hypothetical protein